MKYYYYVSGDKIKDGPHDLVSIMRRIKSGAINPETIFYNEYEEQVAAHQLEELTQFFNAPVQNVRAELESAFRVSIIRFFNTGWDFASSNYGIMVFAGLSIVLPLLFGLLISAFLNIYVSFALGFLLFLFVQAYFFTVSLRLYRGQKVDINFIDKMLDPISASISVISIVFLFTIPLLAMFLIAPALLAILAFIFTSFIIYDNRHPPQKAISAAFLLLRRANKTELFKLCALVLIYAFSVALIFPAPLLLPIFAGGICSIYEELINL